MQTGRERHSAILQTSAADGRALGRTRVIARCHTMPYLYLTLAILAEVIGTSALKASDGFTRPKPSLVVLIGYGVAFYFLSLSLQSLAVGVAYAIWSGAGVALITLIGWRVFKQRLDKPAMLGIALIVAGVVVLHWSSEVVA
jgi:small multidrug resistance pump